MIDVAYEYVQEEKALIKTLREMAAALWSRLSVEEMHSVAKECCEKALRSAGR
jgi:hypothetical protein